MGVITLLQKRTDFSTEKKTTNGLSDYNESCGRKSKSSRPNGSQSLYLLTYRRSYFRC
jgi:hypothetical protein